ncbi:MAG: hypothetical protein RLZZ306_3267 [Bacteroidota bacterium]|jgi:hypothetical protein
MGTLTKEIQSSEIISTPTFSQVVANYSFDEKDKSLEIEWIELELAFAKQKLATGAATLQRTTIARLMDLITELTLKKEYLMDDRESNLANIPDISAWRLHKKSQSGFELKD